MEKLKGRLEAASAAPVFQVGAAPGAAYFMDRGRQQPAGVGSCCARAQAGDAGRVAVNFL